MGFHPIDANQLIADPDKTINTIIENNPDVEFWGIVTERGDGSIDTLGEVSSKRLLLRQIKRYAAKYGDHTQSNFMGNWLHGLQEMSFHNQEEAGEYYAAKKKATVKKKKKWKHSKLIRR